MFLDFPEDRESRPVVREVKAAACMSLRILRPKVMDSNRWRMKCTMGTGVHVHTVAVNTESDSEASACVPACSVLGAQCGSCGSLIEELLDNETGRCSS